MRQAILVAIALFSLLASSPSYAQNNGPNIVNGGFLCNKAAIYDASTNGSTRLVVGGNAIYICGFSIWGGGTATVKLTSGTGTNCGTNNAAVTPAFSLTAQTGVRDDSFMFKGLNVQSGGDLCVTTSAGVAIQAIVYYTQ